MLHEEANWADILVSRCGDIPAGGAHGLKADLQADLMPAIRHQRLKAFSSMDAMDTNHDSRVWAAVVGELELSNFYCV